MVSLNLLNIVAAIKSTKVHKFEKWSKPIQRSIFFLHCIKIEQSDIKNKCLLKQNRNKQNIFLGCYPIFVAIYAAKEFIVMNLL